MLLADRSTSFTDSLASLTNYDGIFGDPDGIRTRDNHLERVAT